MAQAGELLVQVSHAAINPIDWKLFAGPTPLFKASVPYTPGFDFQGVVVGKGSEDIDVDVGESVIGYLGLTETCPVDDNLVPKSGSAGAFAEYCVVPASRVAIIPGSSDPRAMAGLPLAGLTAYQALFTGAGKVSQQGSHSSLFLSPSHAHTLSLSLSLKCLSSPSNRSPCRAPLLVTSRRATRC